MDFYETIASGYDELYAEEQRLKLGIIKENMDIKSTDLLLDVGCGTGISSDFGCRVVGIDPSSLIMQNQIREKLMARAENMPFKDKTFDKVVSITSMHNFDDIKKGISEIKRIGKSHFAFSILKKSAKFSSIEEIIRENFIIEKKLDAGKDWVFICRAKELN